MLTASVIIRTKNEARSLGATLERVFGQRRSPLEVIVIDSGSTDRTLAIANKSDALVLTIPPEEWSHARALNRAADVARADVLVTLSAHCLPVDEDWLGNLLRHFDDPTVAAAWGPQVWRARELADPGAPTRQRPGTYKYENWTWGLTNANGAVCRRLWTDVPFDESFPACEDKQWARVMMERGYQIVHEPAAAVWRGHHSVVATYRRERLVMEGVAMMFPGARSERPRLAKTIVRTAVANVQRRLGHDRSQFAPEPDSLIDVREFDLREFDRIPDEGQPSADVGGGSAPTHEST